MKKFFLFIAALCCAVTINATEGALRGGFSINSFGNKIQFAQGNLQYQASTNTWRFAANQLDTMPMLSISESTGEPNLPSQWRDRIEMRTEYSQQAISNGGNKADHWRILGSDEWTYIMNSRPQAANLRAAATINGTEGYIFLPDDWSVPAGIEFHPSVSSSMNVFTAEQWATMEAAGAVFLPFCTAYNKQYRIVQSQGSSYHLNKVENFYYGSSSYNYVGVGDLNHYYPLRIETNGTCTIEDVSFMLCSHLYCETSGGLSIDTEEYYLFPVRLVQSFEGTEDIKNITTEHAATKRIENGQLLIEKNGKTYNAQGVEVESRK